MSTQTKKARPQFRVSWAAITNTGETTQPQMSKPEDVGAIWPRSNGKGSILRLTKVPESFGKDGAGVIFVTPVTTKGGE